jgi:Raf kinase inhibitor-like YbhB/YbcL family protein
MLEHIPAWLGHAMSGLRAGTDKLAIVHLGETFETLDLTSPAFAHEARMPPRFTADGEGVSPPLAWSTPPSGTAQLVLLVEDADAPAPQPLVHAVVWGLSPEAGHLAEGAIAADGAGAPVDNAPGSDVGRNSYLREGWLPPDPPTGHGEHRYAFQVFAVGAGAGDPGETPGRSAVIDAITGHVLAAGLLIGTYSREETAPIGPVGMAAPA